MNEYLPKAKRNALSSINLQESHFSFGVQPEVKKEKGKSFHLRLYLIIIIPYYISYLIKLNQLLCIIPVKLTASKYIN